MNETIKKFIEGHRIAVVSVLLPDDILHAATIHYAYNEAEVEFYFCTEKASRKCQGLLQGELKKAACVIGFSEEEWLTLQMDGEMEIVTERAKLEDVKRMYYDKLPARKKHADDPSLAYLRFKPAWLRYTDFTAKPPLKIEHTM